MTITAGQPIAAAGDFLCGRFLFAAGRPLVMGIVNLTDDSFSGDGVGAVLDRAISRGIAQAEAGADLLDLGAESSRPGAAPVDEATEIKRLLPVVRELRGQGVALSIDTCKPRVMHAVLEAGADMINDIRGFADSEAIAVVARAKCGVCAMHMRGDPQTMQQSPVYADVVEEVGEFLQRQVNALRSAGVDESRIVVDPGFGFGKRLGHNTELFRAIPEFVRRHRRVLVGVSRKSMLGEITGRPVDERLAASAVAAVLAAQRGAAILRVHDVAATRDALAVLAALGEKA